MSQGLGSAVVHANVSEMACVRVRRGRLIPFGRHLRDESAKLARRLGWSRVGCERLLIGRTFARV